MAMEHQPKSRIGTSSQEPDLMAGFSEDGKNLIEQVVKLFEQKESLRFEDFVTVWKDMNFALIFTGRKLFRELWEFTEEALRSVKEFLLNSHETAERAASLYLLYALYFKQPARPRVKISLTLSDYELLTTFVQDCRSDEHWDISYVWVQLVTNYALVYVANTKPVGLEIMSKTDAMLANSTEGRFRSNLAYKLNLDLFKRSLNNLSEIHEKYCNIKTALTDPGVRDPALGLISDKVPDKLKRLTRLLQSMRGEMVDFDPDDEGDDPQHQREPRVRRPSIGERRKQLREKAFEHTSMTERNKLLMARASYGEFAVQPGISGASDDSADAEYVPSSKVRGRYGSRRGSKVRGRPGRPAGQSQRERSPSKSPIKSPISRGLGPRGRGAVGSSKVLNQEFAEIAQSIEAGKRDPFILEGIVPVQMKSSDAVDSAEQEDLALHPRKAIILHHKKKRKLEAKLRKKRHMEKLKLAKRRNKSEQNADAGSAEEGTSKPKKRGRKKKEKIEKTELQQTEIAAAATSTEMISVGHIVDDDDPLSGLMEVVEVHPPPSTDS